MDNTKQSTIITLFIDSLKNNEIDQALTVLQNATESEKHALLSALASHVQEVKGTQKVQTISILRRTLKPGMTYRDFEKAWMPPTKPYYPFPVQVINGQQFQKQEEVISIGLIQTDIDTVIKTWQKGFMESDKQRAEKIQSVADSAGQAAMYTVSGVYDIGT